MTLDPVVRIQSIQKLELDEKNEIVSNDLFLLLVLFALVPGPRPLYAQAAKNFYEGKVISYYVGSTAGAMTKDEQFIKESEKMGLEIGLIRGEEMNRDIEATMRDKRLMDMYKTITMVK